MQRLYYKNCLWNFSLVKNWNKWSIGKKNKKIVLVFSRLILPYIEAWSHSQLIITNTLKVKIHKWYVKYSTQYYFPTEMNPLEIKTEIYVIIILFLLLKLCSMNFCFLPMRQSLQMQCDVLCPLGGDLPTLITYTFSCSLSLALDKNWNLITAAAHLPGYLR